MAWDETVAQLFTEINYLFEELFREAAETSSDGYSKEKFQRVDLPLVRNCLDKTLQATLLTFGRRGTSLQTIKNFIYDYAEERLDKYFKWFFSRFDIEELVEGTNVEPNEALNVLGSVAMLAWNIYPHKSLGGKSPVELYIATRQTNRIIGKNRPVFEELILRIARRGYLPKNALSLVRKHVFEEDGGRGAFESFRMWFLSLFTEKLNRRQRRMALHIATSAWKLYPHKSLGNKSWLQFNIETTEHCEEEGCREGKDLYVCENCGRIFCSIHAGMHFLHNESRVWRAEAYLEWLDKTLRRISRGEEKRSK